MKSKAELRDKIRRLKKKLKKLEKSKLARKLNTARADLVALEIGMTARNNEIGRLKNQIENLRYSVEVRDKNAAAFATRNQRIIDQENFVEELRRKAEAGYQAQMKLYEVEHELRITQADEKRWRKYAGAGGLDAAEIVAFRAWCVRAAQQVSTSFEQDQTIPPPTNHEGGFHLLMPGGRSTKLRRWADLPGFKLEIWKGSSFLDEVWISDTQVREVTSEAETKIES